MKTIKRLLGTLLVVTMCLGLVGVADVQAEEEEDTVNLVIDGSKAITAENRQYRGIGMVSGNNTSRLLIDYKALHPTEYWEILSYIFSNTGVDVNLLKLEMGSDINSSSGTEPAVKRAEDEKADCTRGAGYQLAADAMKINPNLQLDMLWWSEPKWVSDAEDVYVARYKWYKETLISAYETYEIKFAYVSANQNEKSIDGEWIKYLSKALKSETDCPYDFAAIKIVAADEVGSWSIATKMLADEELLAAVDVIGGHYNDWASSDVKKLAEENGKEVWFSEGCSPMSYSEGTYRYDSTGTGLNDINGVLDIANRIITMVPEGYMTLHELQPLVASYYDGATYSQKQLITADDPWSGYYTLDNGFYMALHFSNFFDKGDCFIEDACYADGVAGGDGHAIIDAHYTYFTTSNQTTGDYSTVVTNTTDHDIVYKFTVSNLAKAGSPVSIWETKGPAKGESYDANYLKKISTITPEEKDGSYVYEVTVAPYSLVTVSTKEVEEKVYDAPTKDEDTVMGLPYEDDFEYTQFADYKAYGKDFLESRGMAPLFTTDQGGAFEVINLDGNNVLMQQITAETKAKEWGGTPNPVTNFGDDRWLNYSVTASVGLEASDEPKQNYVGVGLRYSLGTNGESGYWLALYEDGNWRLRRNSKVILFGEIENFDSTTKHSLSISALYNTLTIAIDGQEIGTYTGESEKDGVMVSDAISGSGRAALYSAYHKNYFDDLKIEAVGEEPYITRIDDTDAPVSYEGAWTHETMGSFKSYNRTDSTGVEGDSVTISFQGTGVRMIATAAKSTVLSLTLDGEEYKTINGPGSSNREAAFGIYELTDGDHELKVTIVEGTIKLDAWEILSSSQKAVTVENDREIPTPTPTPIPAAEPTKEPAQKDEEKTEDKNESKDCNTGLWIGLAVGIAACVAAGGAFIVARKKKKSASKENDSKD